MKRLTIIACVLAVSACAPLPASQRADRDYARAEFRQRFIEDRVRCQAAGRQILVLAYGGQVDDDGIPRTRAYYTCS